MARRRRQAGKGRKKRATAMARRSQAATTQSRPVGFQTPKAVSSVRPVPASRKPHLHTACSVLDPFCVHARSAQRADGLGGPTIPFQHRFINTLATRVDVTTNQGAGQVCVLSDPVYQILDWNTGPVGNAFFNSVKTQVLAPTLLSSYGNEVRIVSWGVIIRNAMPISSAVGTVLVSTVSCPAMSSAFTPGTFQSSNTTAYQLAPNMEISWISVPTGPTAHNFRPVSQFTTTLTDLDWSCCMISVVGSTSGGSAAINLVTYEYVMNLEFTVSSTAVGAATSLAQVQRPPPVPNNIAMAAASRVQSAMQHSYLGGIDYVGKKLEQMANSALNSMLGAAESAMPLLLTM
jgi:hypothetical protein